MRLTGNHKIVSFSTIIPPYWSRSINGVAIQPPQVLTELGDAIDQVLWPFLLSANEATKRSASESWCVVLQVPSADDLTSGRARIDALRPIAQDLLGRMRYRLFLSFWVLASTTLWFVSPVRGSIGSELCRKSFLYRQPDSFCLNEVSLLLCD